MKKFAPIVALAIFALGFTSCKKEWTCECKTTLNGTVTSTSELKTTKLTKKKAKTACNELDEEITMGGQAATVDCEIK